MVRGDLADREQALVEDVNGGADDPAESASRRRGLGKGLGAILSAHGRVDAHAAQRDELTGLPNRLLLDDRLEEALARCREDDASLAVLMVSLDAFSTVNELFGHRVGDDLLRATSERLSAARRKMDTVARFAGDEFVVVCPYIGSTELACLVADRIIEDVSRPVVIDEGEHRLSASVGIVVVGTEGPDRDEEGEPSGGNRHAGRAMEARPGMGAPGTSASAAPGAGRHTAAAGDAGDADTDVDTDADAVGWRGEDTVESVLGDASLAMRHAKEEGGSSWKLFEPSMREVAEVRFQSRRDLHTAMEEGGLEVRYEPIVDLRSGATVGECALPGWGLPDSEDEDPGELLDLIDEAGLASPICRWVLDEALQELRDRRAQGLPPGFRMWVKVAPSLSGDPALVEAVDEFAAKHGVPTALIGIDVREPQVAAMAVVEPVLQALEERNVALAFDDFGMQPSNLALLPSLPVSRLKLSPELSALVDQDDRALVRGLVDFGRALGLTVIAQAVTSDEQAGALRSLGCELAQGAFSVPAEPPEQLWATPSAPEAPPGGAAATAPRHLSAVQHAPGTGPDADGQGDAGELPSSARSGEPSASGGATRPAQTGFEHFGVDQPEDEDVSGHPSYASLHPGAPSRPVQEPHRDRARNEDAMRRLVGLPGVRVGVPEPVGQAPPGPPVGEAGEPDHRGDAPDRGDRAQTEGLEADAEGSSPTAPDHATNEGGGPLFLV